MRSFEPSWLAALEAALGAAAGRAEAGIVTVAVPVEGGNPLGWLATQAAADRWYWQSRDGSDEVAAVGRADACVGAPGEDVASLEEALAARLAAAHDQARFYGALRFDPRPLPAPAWAPFGAYRFVLPRFELRRSDDAWHFAVNLVVPRDREAVPVLMAQVRAFRLEAALPAGALPAPTRRSDTPDHAGWTERVEWALDAFEQGSLDKIVLARCVSLAFADRLDPFRLMARLREATPHCFHYAVAPPGGPVFLGASPERLFRRRGNRLDSEALAGTRPRGSTALDDARLRAELLESEKEQREHGFVRDSLRIAFARLCRTFEMEAEASEMTLAQGRHLRSSLTGVLRPGVTDFDVLRALHPTPAVGGFPREATLDALQAVEPFDRGLYAGPVGWIGPRGAELAVGIRSGLVEGRSLHLYSGAGIVAGSEPAAEWREIEQKLSGFLAVLGVARLQAQS